MVAGVIIENNNKKGTNNNIKIPFRVISIIGIISIDSNYDSSNSISNKKKTKKKTMEKVLESKNNEKKISQH